MFIYGIMIGKKFEEDILCCEKIGKYLDGKVREVFGSRKEASGIFANLIGYKPVSAYNEINNYCGKYLASRISFDGKLSSNNKTLERLAKFYEMLGIEENDKIVKLIKKVNLNFQYPLPKNEDSKICNVKVDFSDKNLSLKPEQLEHLERLALLYASSN